MTPRVLLIHSMLWPNVARLAIAFRKRGFFVDALAPIGHPIHRMNAPHRAFNYDRRAPYSCLKETIAASQPDLIVPCDDRVVGHLHRLHQEASKSDCKIASLIETSLGSPSSYGIVARRASLADLSHLPDVLIPETSQIADIRQLRRWVGQRGLPAVLKLDGSHGGRDVIKITRETDIVPSFLRMFVRKSWIRRLKSMVFDGDAEPFFERKWSSAARVCVQAYVEGRPANIAVASWRGEVLASTAVEVLESRSAFGLATVVRRIDGIAMVAAARAIVKELQLSGFHGFDFVIEKATGRAYLIEINPRATQINHFPGWKYLDLIQTLFNVTSGRVGATAEKRWPVDEVALFPQEWQRDPNSKWLSAAFHDVPHEEPELLRYFGYSEVEEARL
jgi:hypothetical protein